MKVKVQYAYILLYYIFIILTQKLFMYMYSVA